MGIEEEPNLYDSQERVLVQWRTNDFLVAALALQLGVMSYDEFAKLPQNNIQMITLEDIVNFCGKCDFFDEGVCIFFGRQDQTRYVARKWCGGASVNGIRGMMTQDGFI